MNPTRSLVLVLALALAAPVPASALGGFLHPGFGGGISVPAGDLEHAFDNGIHGQLFLGIGNGPLGGRIALDYQHFNAKNLGTYVTGGGGTSGGTIGGTGSILGAMANLSYGIPVGPVKPYVTAGVGALSLGAKPDLGGSTSDVHFALNGGLGVGFKLGPVNAFLEGRYDHLFTDKGLDAGATTADKFKAQVIPVTFGITL